MELTAREVAFNILYDIYVNGAFSNIAINEHVRVLLNNKDENLVREIVYGVLENELYIDYIISKVSNIKLKKIHNKILIILRTGIYQLLFMDKIPDSAAVNESVNLAKKHGHKGSIGFVNGILRNVSKNKEELLEITTKDKADYLSIKYSHPKWMVKRWINEFGVDFTEKICKKNNEYPELHIRVNTLKVNKNDLKEKLSSKGLIVKNASYAYDSLIIENPVRITELDEFKSGLFIIQDESSTMVGQIMNPISGSKIIDLCSAPGGKATHLAQIMNNCGKILCFDIYEHKLRLIDDNAKRLGISIIETKLGDALELNEALINTADYLLVDSPCSGLGLIRRKPEIKRNRNEDDIVNLIDIQYKILNNAKEYLKIGGFLLYSTCTIEQDENTNMVNKFLKQNSNFRLVNIEDNISNKDNLNSLKHGYIQLYPHIHNTDGFFIAKMIKER